MFIIIATIMLETLYSALRDNKEVIVPAPAIIGKASGTIDAVSGTSSLYNDIPKIISIAKKKITIDPATANELTSIPIKLRISSPTKRKEIIINAAINEAFPD